MINQQLVFLGIHSIHRLLLLLQPQHQLQLLLRLRLKLQLHPTQQATPPQVTLPPTPLPRLLHPATYRSRPIPMSPLRKPQLLPSTLLHHQQLTQLLHPTLLINRQPSLKKRST